MFEKGGEGILPKYLLLAFYKFVHLNKILRRIGSTKHLTAVEAMNSSTSREGFKAQVKNVALPYIKIKLKELERWLREEASCSCRGL